MNYKEFKEKQEAEVNEFSKDNIIVILESNKEKALAKLEAEGLTVEDVVNLGAGLYLKKEAVPEWESLINRLETEKHEYILANVYEAVNYECWNYEIEISLSYTYSDVPTKLLGLTSEEVAENEEEIQKAFKDYKEEFYKLN